MHIRTHAIATVLGLVATALVGCTARTTPPVDGNSTENTGYDSAALDSENGGYTNTDEAPYFGDSSVEALTAFNTTFADTSDMTVAAASTTGAVSYHIALLWGHLPVANDTSDSDVTPQPASWTGSVSVDAGGIGLERTLAFDANDHVDPRTVPQSISFVSHTLPFVDGLFLHVVVPAGSTMLHFDTDTLKTDVDLTQLDAKAGGIVQAGDGRNGLAFIGYPDVAGCDRGLLFGRWVKARAMLGGFRGQVLGDDGDVVGHVRGIWGRAPKKGENVFFGKYISPTGKFQGLLGGTYGNGEAQGVWGIDATKDNGVLQAFYSDGYDMNDGRGVFVGRWSQTCAK